MSELLQKVVDTSKLGEANGGLLNTEQSNKFLDYMWDETTLTDGHVRQVRISANERDIDKMHLGRRIARGAVEGVDTGVNASPTFSKVTVRTTKFRLDWELTTETLEDGIEGGDLDNHIASLMARQFGNDMEDVSINGDTALTDPLLKQFDGYRKLAKANGTWLAADTPSDGLTTDVFNKALKNLGRQWLQRKQDLRFYTSAGLVQDFLKKLEARETPIGDEIIYDTANRQVSGGGGTVNIRPYGIPVVEVPLFSEGYASGGDDPDANPTPSYGYVELTFPTNRLWVTKREVQVYREFQPKKDSIEYTVYIRHGVQWENLKDDAHSSAVGNGPYVGIYNVQVQ